MPSCPSIDDVMACGRTGIQLVTFTTLTFFHLWTCIPLATDTPSIDTAIHVGTDTGPLVPTSTLTIITTIVTGDTTHPDDDFVNLAIAIIVLAIADFILLDEPTGQSPLFANEGPIPTIILTPHELTLHSQLRVGAAISGLGVTIIVLSITDIRPPNTRFRVAYGSPSILTAFEFALIRARPFTSGTGLA